MENYREIIDLIALQYSFKFHLHYEIVVYDFNYPNIKFSQEFLEFIVSLNFEYSITIYND